MRKSLLISTVTFFSFVVVSVVGADILSPLEKMNRHGKESAVKSVAAFKDGQAIDARAYRSPGTRRKIVIAADDAESLNQVKSSGAIELADYGSFKLFAIDQDADEGLRMKSSGNESSAPLSKSSLAVRDDFNVLLLRSEAIDTTAEDAPGNFFGGGTLSEPGRKSQQKTRGDEKLNKSGLRLIQFVGPVKREWLDELRINGLEPVAYVPNNAYIVRGGSQSSERVANLALDARARGENFIQWEGPLAPQYKIHPALAQTINEQAINGQDQDVLVAVQMARGLDDRTSKTDSAIDSDVSAAKRLASSLVGDAYPVLNFVNLKMRIAASRIAELAALDNVVSVEPWSPPQMLDERASQILAGELSDDGKQPRGSGYLAWLQARGLASRFSFAIDVTDTGLDRGSINAANLHPDFLDSAGQSRVVYARDYTSELDGGDVPGHGTINASIAVGGNTSDGKNARDSLGFNHGLGVAPLALVGSSKIFQSNGRYDLVDPYTKLVSEAYRDGARISSNSWGAGTNDYTIESQEYDARVRDAAPNQPGNQEMVICFAAGNSGPGGRIWSPGTAKNIISVAASENFRKAGADGCGVKDADADSALDIAFFSSGGQVSDGRLKPDITAPGTHIQGAASQHPDFTGAGICGEDFDKPYFPTDQTLYTWSSGTSHSTPQIAGAAALIRQFFLNQGQEPSAAFIKALLVNTTSYLTGSGAGGDLPHPRQGWGLANLGRALDNAPKILIDQTRVFTDSGQEFVMTGEVKDPARPFRVTLAWTDAPGLSVAAPWVNDLDLEVTINGQVYRGNNFLGQDSQPGGEPNTKDNTEGVWLPAGTVGAFVIRARASNIAGDAVPGNTDSTDQDFALVAYNAERKDAAVASLGGVSVAGGADAVADPGESVSMTINIKNVSPAAMNSARGTLTTSTQGVSVTAGSVDFPNIAPSSAGDSLSAFRFNIDRSVPCGTEIQFALDVNSQGAVSRVPFTLTVGRAQPIEMFADDVESGEAKWSHGSGIKKKKNRIDTWTISTKRFHSSGKSWFTPNLPKLTDAHLDTLPVTLPADGRNLRLVFFHTFEFEPGRFDGGVIEISTGGSFEDLGSKILLGRYNDAIQDFTDNPLAGRAGWVNGRLGAFKQVVVDLSSFAGKTVVIRFRVGTDRDIASLGWYIDDFVIKGDRVTCSPVALAQ